MYPYEIDPRYPANHRFYDARYLERLFVYEPVEGKFSWVGQRPMDQFPTRQGWLIWHKRFAGKPTGSYVYKTEVVTPAVVGLNGMRPPVTRKVPRALVLRAEGQVFMGARVAWTLMTGSDPAMLGYPHNTRGQTLQTDGKVKFIDGNARNHSWWNLGIYSQTERVYVPGPVFMRHSQEAMAAMHEAALAARPAPETKP